MPQIRRKFYMSAQDKINMATDVRKQTIAQLIDTYSSSTTYKLGDFCNKDGVIYKCTTAITTAEAWNADHWAVAKLNEVIDAINEAVASVDGKANVDGNYPTMSVGLADNLTSPDGVTNEEPYVFRPTAGTTSVADGYASIKKLKGNTIVWNQLHDIKVGGDYNSDGIHTHYTKESKTILYEGTATITKNRDLIIYDNVQHNLILGHKYAVIFDKKGESANTGFYIAGLTGIIPMEDTILTAFETSMYGQAVIYEGETVNFTIRPQVFDLTLMFGAGNEPTSVEEFKALFPNTYYPYNEGELIHARPMRIKTVGFNAFDGELEIGGLSSSDGATFTSNSNIRTKNFIPVIGGATYTLKNPTFDFSQWFLYGYDNDKKFIKAIDWEVQSTVETCIYKIPSNCRFVKVRWLNFTDYSTLPTNQQICFHLTHSGYRNGEFEEHWQEERNLNTETYFYAGMKSAGTAYDELTPTKAIKRIGIVDLGTLNWSKSNDNRVNCVINDIKVINSSTVLNATCSGGYEPITDGQADSASSDMQMAQVGNSTTIMFYKQGAFANVSTNNEIATMFNGVMLAYELATPIETDVEQTRDVNWNYRISDFGTEEFITSSIVPVAHETFYMRNLRDSLRSLDSVVETTNNSTKIKTKEGYGYIEINGTVITLFNGGVYARLQGDTIKLESRTFEYYNFDLLEFLTPTIVHENWVDGQTFANKQVIENYIQTHNRIIDSSYGELFIFKYSENQIVLRSQGQIDGHYKFYNFSGSTDSSWSLTIVEE